MVALLSQCFPGEKIGKPVNKEPELGKIADDITVQEKSPIKQPEIQQMHMETGSNILQQQFDELKEYSKYLEKEVEEYKKYIEERFEKLKNQKYQPLVEGFGGSSETKNLNDIIVYLMTCIFILLLVDYIFKMGKNSY